jgi:PAS domain S-box-containing protein
MSVAEQLCYLDEEREQRRRAYAPVVDIPGGVDWYQALLMENGDSIFIARQDRSIEAVNRTAETLHGKDRVDLIGLPCEVVITAGDRTAFITAWKQLDEKGQWSARIEASRGNGDGFPAFATARKLPEVYGPYVWVSIRDLSELEVLKKRLEYEKANRREMYETLRSLVKSSDKERRGLECSILNKIEGLLLPALVRIEKENCADIRNSYLNILRMELVGLTKGFNRELEAPMLKLTRTEMRVCCLIQKGYSSKEIADTTNVSFETIQVHRRNIRKKLGLTGRSVNLFSFLSSKPFLRAPAMT